MVSSFFHCHTKKSCELKNGITNSRAENRAKIPPWVADNRFWTARDWGRHDWSLYRRNSKKVGRPWEKWLLNKVGRPDQCCPKVPTSYARNASSVHNVRTCAKGHNRNKTKQLFIAPASDNSKGYKLLLYEDPVETAKVGKQLKFCTWDTADAAS